MDYNPFVETRTAQTVLPRSKVTVSFREVTLDEGLRFAEVQGLEMDAKVAAIKSFITTIATWDAKDRKTGEALPLTTDLLGKLPVEDGNHLVKEVMAFINPPDEGKGSPPSVVS
jgi:hypothetical protein